MATLKGNISRNLFIFFSIDKGKCFYRGIECPRI